MLTGMTPPKTLYVGVHRRVDNPFGVVIDTMSRIFHQGAPVLPGGHATHVFVAFAWGGAMPPWRMDAAPPVAFWSPMGVEPSFPFRLWKVEATPAAVQAAWMMAQQQAGKVYDWTEIAAQAAPWGGTGAPGGAVCTSATCAILEACDGPVAELAKFIMQGTHYPEECARRFTARPELFQPVRWQDVALPGVHP